MFNLSCHASQRGNKQSIITKYFQSTTSTAERRKRCNLVYDDHPSSYLQSEKKRKITPGTTSFDEMDSVASSLKHGRKYARGGKGVVFISCTRSPIHLLLWAASRINA